VLHKLAWLAVAGGAGTLLRYWVGGVVPRFCGESFPWGTLVINALGCLLFGLVSTLTEERLIISGETRQILLTGFMGAFTTFSTFAFETGEFMRDAQWWAAIVNLLAQNGLGLLCLFVGFAVGRYF